MLRGQRNKRRGGNLRSQLCSEQTRLSENAVQDTSCTRRNNVYHRRTGGECAACAS